jgi:hypothetical protein
MVTTTMMIATMVIGCRTPTVLLKTKICRKDGEDSAEKVTTMKMVTMVMTMKMVTMVMVVADGSDDIGVNE